MVDVLADELQDPEVRVQFRHVVTYQLTELRVFDLKNKNVRAAVRSGHRRGEWLLKTVRGFCRGFERNGGRVWEIFAPVSARTRLALDTLAHEVMHALLPGLKEIEVNAVASLGSALLWALGWRKKG
ncbi:MAG: hypothetical protein N3A53_01605 [Verrucomicrobiae bacterium]|nr:hypothetical protein [Verrucomicrobiae bacterium]